MTTHQILSREDWTAARRKLLDDEKAFTKARDKLSAARTSSSRMQLVRAASSCAAACDTGKSPFVYP